MSDVGTSHTAGHTGGHAGGVGLRERKKARTRREIAAAAARLMTERGFDGVTIEQIAAEAEIAPRTFFRYFGSKEAALLADYPDRIDAMRTALVEHVTNESPIAAVRAALLALAASQEQDRELMVTRASLIRATPSLRAWSLGFQASWGETLAEGLAARLPAHGRRDLRPRVFAAAALAAYRIAVDTWLERGGRGSLRTLVADALDVLDLEHALEVG